MKNISIYIFLLFSFLILGCNERVTQSDGKKIVRMCDQVHGARVQGENWKEKDRFFFMDRQYFMLELETETEIKQRWYFKYNERQQTYSCKCDEKIPTKN